MLAEIVAQDDDWLEITHDYIQWLFPLTEHSRVTPGAPTMLPDDIRVFKEDDLLQGHMLIAFKRMLRFYGLESTGTEIAKGYNWEQRKTNWFTEPTHNNVRITRILKSLALSGLEREAVRLQVALESLCNTEPGCGVPEESRVFWRRAVTPSGRGAA